LNELFKILINNKIDDIGNIFNELKNSDVVKIKEPITMNENKSITPNSDKGLSFILPAPGNEITQSDILSNQLRVTADYKNHFPHNNAVLKFTYDGVKYDVKFTNRGKRSHILKLGSALMKLLNLTPNSSVRITKINSIEFTVEKIR